MLEGQDKLEKGTQVSDKKKVRCVICNQPPEVASITHKLYIHDCPVAERRMYTNGKIWSDSPNNIQGAKR